MTRPVWLNPLPAAVSSRTSPAASAAHVCRMLDERPDHTAPRERFLGELEDHLSQDDAERTLSAVSPVSGVSSFRRCAWDRQGHIWGASRRLIALPKHSGKPIMKRTLLAAGAVMLMASGAAYAQTTKPAVPGYPDVKDVPVDTTPTATMPADGSGIRQQLAANLQKAGFTGVKIVPEAFIIQATNKSGDPVVMLLSPDSLTVFTADDAKGKDARTVATDAAPSGTAKP